MTQTNKTFAETGSGVLAPRAGFWPTETVNHIGSYSYVDNGYRAYVPPQTDNDFYDDQVNLIT